MYVGLFFFNSQNGTNELRRNKLLQKTKLGYKNVAYKKKQKQSTKHRYRPVELYYHRQLFNITVKQNKNKTKNAL